MDQIRWCRDARCRIVALHPEHYVRPRQGRTSFLNEGDRQAQKEKNRRLLKPMDELHQSTTCCRWCRGKGWAKDPLSACVLCLGTGHVSGMMKARDREKARNPDR